jgi:hypothetical protein
MFVQTQFLPPAEERSKVLHPDHFLAPAVPALYMQGGNPDEEIGFLRRLLGGKSVTATKVANPAARGLAFNNFANQVSRHSTAVTCLASQN